MEMFNLLPAIVGGCVGAGITAMVTHHREQVKMRTERLEKLGGLCVKLIGDCARMVQMKGEGNAFAPELIAEAVALGTLGEIVLLTQLHFPGLAKEVGNALDKIKDLATAVDDEEMDLESFLAIYRIAHEAASGLQGKVIEEGPALVGRARPRLRGWWDRKCQGE